MVRTHYGLMLTAIVVVSPLTSLAKEDYPAELRRCSLIDEPSARLNCYDTISGRNSPPASESAKLPQKAPVQSGQKIVDPAAVETATAGEGMAGKGVVDDKAAETNSPDLKGLEEEVSKEEIADTKTLDDLGSETLPPAARGNIEKLEVRARVAQCEKDVWKKYLFHFDNGQVWKQTSDKKLYFRDCDFYVTITKDFFGYKMQVDGEKGRIRISRLK